MVMSFENQKALNFLLANGFVYTFRTKKRKKLGKDWINARRGLPKIANVNITFIREIRTSEHLRFYDSGFTGLQEWLDAISDLDGEKVYNDLISGSNHKCGYLYRVSLRFGEFSGNRKGKW